MIIRITINRNKHILLDQILQLFRIYPFLTEYAFFILLRNLWVFPSLFLFDSHGFLHRRTFPSRSHKSCDLFRRLVHNLLLRFIDVAEPWRLFLFFRFPNFGDPSTFARQLYLNFLCGSVSGREFPLTLFLKWWILVRSARSGSVNFVGLNLIFVTASGIL